MMKHESQGMNASGYSTRLVVRENATPGDAKVGHSPLRSNSRSRSPGQNRSSYPGSTLQQSRVVRPNINERPD